ncbi:MAG: hypothetical protein HGB21_07760 [Nitrospirae bacterium]|nr:hypothetical protein [Nitrospirota bacterium]NTW66182.1 hypothetical protein [Nitrospirota bacterium]
MPTVLIDYIPFYYTSIAQTAIPPVVSGKFVQIRNGNTLYLVLSPKELTKYHGNIVERFCMDKGIEGSYDTKREKFAILDQAWVIVGGGKFERDGIYKAIKLYNNSMAYGKFDATGLKELLIALPEFSGYTVTIE